MTVDGHNQRHSSARILAVLAIAVLGSILLARLFLGEPTTERAVPVPSVTALAPTPPASTPSAPLAPPASTPSAPLSPPAPGPTPTALPIPESPSSPEGSCPLQLPIGVRPGDRTLIEVVYGGVQAAVASKPRSEDRDGLREFDVYSPRFDCRWVPLGQLKEGTTRDQDGNIVTYTWTCSIGVDGYDLVQISSRTFPEHVTTVQHLTIEDGVMLRHQESTVVGDLFEPLLRPQACSPNYWLPAYALEARSCGGRNWTLDLPDDWKTPVIGAWSCAWFDQRDMAFPCQCDAIAPISIELVDEPAEGFEVIESTVVDGYPAEIAERSFVGMGNGPTTERAYLVNLGNEFLVLRASDGEWSGSWEYLSDVLDQFAEAIDIVGMPIPTMEMRYPDFPFLAHQPIYLDPAGNFAWYTMDDPLPPPPCDGAEPARLARLDIAASQTDNLEFDVVGPIPAGILFTVQEVDARSALVGVRCGDGDETLNRYYRIEFEADGSVVGFAEATEPEPLWPPPRRFATSPDGRYRFASGLDPLERDGSHCQDHSGQSSPPIASTMLRYEGTTITPAFRDIGISGAVSNMSITDTRFAVWMSNGCDRTELYLGRIDTDGYIIDRHVIDASIGAATQWTITADDELIVLQSSYVQPDQFLPRAEDGSHEGGNTESFPALYRLDLATSSGWVNTAESSPAVTGGEVSRSFDDAVGWYLADNPAPSEKCGGKTILAEHPEGWRRVSAHWADIDGDVVDVLTSDVTNGSRAVVALVACPERYEGYTVWFARERSGQDVVVFDRAAVDPLSSLADLRMISEEAPFYSRIEATATLLDGTRRTIALIKAD